jgi:hypothetical protein
MKSWLAKFRISTALDSGRPLPESLRRAIAADSELDRFARRAQDLGRALRNPPPGQPALRDSIMRAVRVAARERQPRRAPQTAWLAASGVLAAVAVICVWMNFHRQASPGARSLDGPVVVLEMSEEMPKTMPAFVMAPLSDEWARVDRNVHDTTQVLLASFP